MFSRRRCDDLACTNCNFDDPGPCIYWHNVNRIKKSWSWGTKGVRWYQKVFFFLLVYPMIPDILRFDYEL